MILSQGWGREKAISAFSPSTGRNKSGFFCATDRTRPVLRDILERDSGWYTAVTLSRIIDMTTNRAHHFLHGHRFSSNNYRWEYISPESCCWIQAALSWYRGFRASRKLNLATMRPHSFRRFRAFLMVLGEKETFPTISFSVRGLPSSRRENTAFAEDGSCSIFGSVFCVACIIFSHLILMVLFIARSVTLSHPPR